MSVAVDSDAEDDAVSEIAEAAGVSPAPAKPSMSAPRRMLLFGLVVVVALAVLLCCWGFRVQRARHAQDQRGHFLQAARQCALNLTTIDWRNARRMCAAFWTAPQASFTTTSPSGPSPSSKY